MVEEGHSWVDADPFGDWGPPPPRVLGAVGACRGHENPSLFFPPKGAHGGDAAKRVCAACVVRSVCAEYALADPNIRGIWGGMTDRARRIERQRRASTTVGGQSLPAQAA